MKKLASFAKLGSLNRIILFNTINVFPEDLKSIGIQPGFCFEYREHIVAMAQKLFPGEPIRQAMFSDLHTFLCSLLDRNDRQTMGASIECRVPFLDYRLVEGLAALPTSTLIGRQNKQLLRDSIGDRLPSQFTRPQMGFGVQWSQYLRDVVELREWIKALPMIKVIRDGPFNRSLIQTEINRFLKGNNDRAELIRALFMVALWHESYFSRLKDLQG